MIRRLLPLAGVLLAIAPHNAKATGLTDPYAECWWHISHYHCGNEIVFVTTTTAGETTTTTSTTTTTTTEPPPEPTTTTTAAPAPDKTFQPITIAPAIATTSTTQATTSTQVPTTTTTVPIPTSTTPALATTTTVRTPLSTTTTPTPLRPTATTPATSPTTNPTTTTTLEPSTTTIPQLETLTEQQITPEIIEQIQNAPESVRREFEQSINIYGGAAETYIPIGSRVPVRTRRVIIITSGLLVASPRPRRKP